MLLWKVPQWKSQGGMRGTAPWRDPIGMGAQTAGIPHSLLGNREGSLAPRPSCLCLCRPKGPFDHPHAFPWEMAPGGGAALFHPLFQPKPLSCLWSCCLPGTPWSCLSRWGPGCPGEVTEAEGKAGTCSAAGAEASLTLFPAAASAISIYSPAASPPGHSAAAAAGFQGCSVIKHPCLLQLLHFASPAAIGAGGAPGSMATPKGCSLAMVGRLLGMGMVASLCSLCPV